MEIDEVIPIPNQKFVMMPTVHLKDKIKPAQVLLTLINLSDEVIQIGKHTITGTLQLKVNDQELQDFKIYKLNVEKSDTNLPCAPTSAKFMFSCRSKYI